MRDFFESNKKRIMGLAIALSVLNSVTYAGARAYWRITGGVAAELQVVREAGEGEVMNYLVAGNVNLPETAFKFLEDKLDGGVTYVTYARKRGCSMPQIVEQVLNDARRRSCKVRVLGISIGDYVSRFAEQKLRAGVETVAINPEPHPDILKPYANIGLKVFACIPGGPVVRYFALRRCAARHP